MTYYLYCKQALNLSKYIVLVIGCEDRNQFDYYRIISNEGGGGPYIQM